MILKIKGFIIGFSLITIISCEKEITSDFDKFEPQLVINSILNPDTYFQVQVGHTSKMTDTSNVLIDKAIVELWMDNKLIESLGYVGQGLYKSEMSKPMPGHIYQIKVSAPGYEEVTAYDTIPLTVEITDAFYIFHFETDINRPSNADMVVEFSDPFDEENYYELIFYSKYTHYDYWNGYNDTVTTISYYNDFLIYDPILIAEGDIDYKPTSAYFSDKLFDGKKVTISLNIDTYGGGWLNGICDFGGGFKIAELRTISYSYFQYRKKWTQHLYNQGIDLNIQDSDEFRAFLFTGEPVNMFSNVENGYGVFIGYAESSVIMRKENNCD